MQPAARTQSNLGNNMSSAEKIAPAAEIALEPGVRGTRIGASVAQIVTEAQIVRGNVQ